MNFSQLHERLRLELRRRIERKVVTASEIARRTGLHQPHISKFIHSKGSFSHASLDRVLAALEMDLVELLDDGDLAPEPTREQPTIPVVSAYSAMFEDYPRPSAEQIAFPLAIMSRLRAAQNASRSSRERFVAVSLTAEQARPMEPILMPGSIVVLDRHCVPPGGTPDPPGEADPRIYAVRLDQALYFCYLDIQKNLLLLRPHVLSLPVQTVSLSNPSRLSELIVGQVCSSLVTY